MESEQDDLDLEKFYHRRNERSLVPWFIGAGLIAVLIGTIYLYDHMEQRGISIHGEGHLSVLPNGETWVFFLSGLQVKATAESAHKLNARPGPCSRIEGAMKGDLPIFEIDVLECTPGASVVQRITARMQDLGVTFGYWPKEIEFTGQSIAQSANTLEIMLSMMDERASEPQLIPLYDALFPQTLIGARPNAPPPLIIHVARNDLVMNRLGREDLASFLNQPKFVLAGSAQKGGWLIRTLDVTMDGAQSLERLLIEPSEQPWPKLLREPIVHVARRRADASEPGARKE